MIPLTLSSTEAQRLLDLGRAWLAGPEHLTTRRAAYRWNTQTQRYERQHIASSREEHPDRRSPITAVSADIRSAGLHGFLWCVVIGLGTLLTMLILGKTVFHTSGLPAPRDWSATLRAMEGKINAEGGKRGPYFTPTAETFDGWPMYRTLEGAAALECIQPNVAGPHTLPTQQEWNAIKACAQKVLDDIAAIKY